MVVDAMLKSTADKKASAIYRTILGQEGSALLDSIHKGCANLPQHMPLWWVVRHSLGLQGWEGGDDRPGLMGSPSPCTGWGLDGLGTGAGVVVDASLVDLQKMSGEGRGWHSDYDKHLTQTRR
jgi:hypothetical protein